jgi:hypothetical protein
MRRRIVFLIASISIALSFGRGVPAQLSPARVPTDPDVYAKAIDARFDFDRREEMIPMRDGAKLFTVS